jgi:hypothetical protein
MKKIIFFILCISLISFISALDENLVISCGGDESLVISCIGDEDLFFIGYIPAPTPGTGGTSETITKPKVGVMQSILSSTSLSLGSYTINGFWIIFPLIIAVIFLLVVIEEEERKKRKRKV